MKPKANNESSTMTNGLPVAFSPAASEDHSLLTSSGTSGVTFPGVELSNILTKTSVLSVTVLLYPPSIGIRYSPGSPRISI